jgi:hypothetical protein
MKKLNWTEREDAILSDLYGEKTYSNIQLAEKELCLFLEN